MNISIRQATLLFVMYQIGSSFIMLPSLISSIAKQDAWLSVIVTLGLFLLCVPLYASIANQLQGKTLGQHLNVIFGHWVGDTLKIVFIVCFPLFIFIKTLRELSDFVAISIMPDTPVEIIYIMMLFTVYFAIRAGIVVIGRSAELLFFVLIFLFVLVALSLIPSAKLEYILPLFEYGIKPIVRASFPLLGSPYLESAILLYLVSNMSEPHKWKKAIIQSSLISGSTYLLMIIITTAVLSEGVMSNLTFASYFVIRTINIADFVERFEIVVTVFWYITIFFRLSLLLFVTVHGLADIFKLKDANSLIIPLMLISFAMTYTMWPNTTLSMKFNQVYPWYAMVFGLIGPAFIWLIGKMRAPA